MSLVFRLENLTNVSLANIDSGFGSRSMLPALYKGAIVFPSTRAG